MKTSNLLFPVLSSCAVLATVLASAASAQTAELAYRYPLDTDASNTIGGVPDYDGTLESRDANPGGVFEDGGLTLSGNGYVHLPQFLLGDFWYNVGEVNNLTPVTLEVFGSWAGGDANQRLFDFGDNDLEDPLDPPFGGGQTGRTSVSLTPANSAGELNFNFSADPTGANELSDVGTINATGLGASQDFHVVVVIDPATDTTRMYRNGVLAGTGTLPDTLRQGLWDGVALYDLNNWLGRSQTDGDPLFSGRLTEFRVWRGAMSEAQVRQNFNCGPDNPDGCSVGPTPTLTVARTGADVTVSWPADALGFNLHFLNALGGGSSWSPAVDQPLTSDGVRTAIIPVEGSATFLQLQTDN